jgi:hypothetical protein
MGLQSTKDSAHTLQGQAECAFLIWQGFCAKMAFLEGDELEKALLGFVKAQDSTLDPAAVRSLQTFKTLPCHVIDSGQSCLKVSAPLYILRVPLHFSHQYEGEDDN